MYCFDTQFEFDAELDGRIDDEPEVDDGFDAEAENESRVQQRDSSEDFMRGES